MRPEKLAEHITYLNNEIAGLEAVYYSVVEHPTPFDENAKCVRLAVLAICGIAPEELTRLGKECSEMAGETVLIVDLHDACPEFISNVLEYSKNIYCKNPEYISNFETFALARYSYMIDERISTLN